MMRSYSREINVQNALDYSQRWALLPEKWKCIWGGCSFSEGSVKNLKRLVPVNADNEEKFRL